SLKRRRLDLFWLALDLAVPPLSLLVAFLFLATLVAGITAWLGGWLAPLVMLATAVILVASAVLAAWAVYCRQQIPLRSLLLAPFYIVAKLPIYVAFITRRQQHWVRTQRDTAC